MAEPKTVLTDRQKLDLIFDELAKIKEEIGGVLEYVKKREDGIETKHQTPLPPAETDKFDHLPWWPGKKGSQNIKIMILRTLADPVGNELLKLFQDRHIPFETDAYRYSTWEADSGEDVISRFKKRAN